MSLLTLENVSVSYGQFRALRDISLSINKGEAVAVLGANGAGKTTLLRAISGMLPVHTGRITMGETEISAITPHRIIETGVAHVPENRRLFPGLSVEANLRLGAYPRHARPFFREQLEYVYTLFPRLKERRHQLAGTMSGGEQQMCAIGRALMSKPQLILLDEPSTGLAPIIVAQVFSLVRKIRSEGYTVLIVEQSVRQVLKVVDRAYLLEAGHLQASGSAQEMLDSKTVLHSYMGIKS
ncbi:ABC transporter ATP-binding protein [Castellaniella defragrans]|uniref:ABC transporter ATP-binding protein n=1 Tax=Castellaniella defragrans TaxID=75697 RepID=UPI0023F3DB9F|nr:ABC transporter ATP-binding protein [Castellaniella defragrans]